MVEHSPLHLGEVAIEKGGFGSPSTKVANFTYHIITLSQILSTLHFISHLVYHKPTKWDSDNHKLFIYIYIYIYIYWIHRLIGLVGRVFTNGPGYQGSIPGRVIQKTFKKLVLDTSLLKSQHYISRVKWSNSGKRVALSPTPWSHRITLDYSRQLYYFILNSDFFLRLDWSSYQSLRAKSILLLNP